MRKIIRLPERLKAIAEYIEKDAAVADIGTDHGYLPVYLAQTGHAREIIAVDASAGSLGTAKKNAAKYDVAEKIKFIHSAGLEAVAPDDIDTCVIAGIGGENILGILDNAPWTKEACRSGKLKLILQPQTKLDVLLAFLQNSGYKVNLQSTVTDKNREYRIFCLF